MNKNEKRNFFLQLIVQGMIKLGDSLIDVKTVLPWIMQTLGAPVLLTSFLVPLRESGSLLPQFWWSTWVKHQSQRKRAWIIGGIGQACAVAGMAFTVFYFESFIAGVLLLLAVAIFSLARSLSSIASKDVMGRTIPKRRRGALSGWSASVGGAITLMLGLWLWKNKNPDPSIYIVLLLIAVGLWLIASFLYGLINEPKNTDEETTTKPTKLSLLWEDKEFGRFVLVRTLFLSSALVTPYYTLLIHSSSENISTLGVLMIAGSVAAIAAGPIWGKMADWSSRLTLVAAGCLVAITGAAFVGFISLEEAASEKWLVAFFFCVMFAHQGVRLGRKTYVVDMADGNKRTDYVALGNAFIGGMLLICALFGIVAQLISVNLVIILLSVMSFFASMVALRLPEVEALAEK